MGEKGEQKERGGASPKQRKGENKNGSEESIPEKVDRTDATGCIINYDETAPVATEIERDYKTIRIHHQNESGRNGYVIVESDKVQKLMRKYEGGVTKKRRMVK